MLKSILSGTLGIAVNIAPCFAIANNLKPPYPLPNKSGDYNSILTTNPKGKNGPHYYWTVVSNQLNCRSQPGIDKTTVKVLSKNYGMSIAGKPQVFRDKKGQPWLYIAGVGSASDIKLRCYVRANSQFIQPVPYDL
jgi:hypothetical protein